MSVASITDFFHFIDVNKVEIPHTLIQKSHPPLSYTVAEGKPMFHLLFLLLPQASAFCGTFVGGEGSTFSNRSSSVIMARQGNHTTLTVAMDYTGDAREFGLLLPVPKVLTAADVRVADSALVQKVQLYASPRMVSYSCDDVSTLSDAAVPVCGFALGCSSQSDLQNGFLMGEGAASNVEVESTFNVANYEISVLSAQGSFGLMAWLDQNGYQVPEGGQDILQEYIDAGVYFLAAKVALPEEDTATEHWLPPLQFSYETETMGLPIRIGTISSAGTQDVQIFTLTDPEAGEVHISNYPEVFTEKECMPPGGSSDISHIYEGMLEDALQGEAGWLVEYSWKMAGNINEGLHCDPCTIDEPFTAEEIQALGYNAQTGSDGSYDFGQFTALRVRYTAEQATQDLSMYYSPFDGPVQARYIQYRFEMEQFFPICGEGWDPNPGTCVDGLEEGSCSVGKQETSLVALVAVLGMVWKRRRL